jgi:competence protein CoiA
VFYAAVPGSERAPATPQAKGSCPACGEPVIAKCGAIVTWHWAHQARAECDPWAERDTAWHLDWQQAVPPGRREVVIGPHRADVITANGWVVELQHSGISPAVIAEREAFYGRMVWLFDVTEAARCGRFSLRPHRPRPPRGAGCVKPGCSASGCSREPGPCGFGQAPEPDPPPGAAVPYVTFRWMYPRRSIAVCQRPVLLDLGDGTVFRVGRLSPNSWEPSWGHTASAASVRTWMATGAELEWGASQPG